ncbi:hypothetical protein PQQ75_00565 [Paraburkholderia aspalathi]|uniref:hypothetical protein n=1 Tax=Paraburkholderia aspalathi TaxID=1324617 RepID=UPI0038B7A912
MISTNMAGVCSSESLSMTAPHHAEPCSWLFQDQTVPGAQRLLRQQVFASVNVMLRTNPVASIGLSDD